MRYYLMSHFNNYVQFESHSWYGYKNGKPLPNCDRPDESLSTVSASLGWYRVLSIVLPFLSPLFIVTQDMALPSSSSIPQTESPETLFYDYLCRSHVKPIWGFLKVHDAMNI